MTSLPTIVEAENYHVQVQWNNNQASQLFNTLFPDVEPALLMESLNILAYLHETKVNPQILPRVIRGIHNIMIGTGLGQVIVHVKGAETNISVRETDSNELKTSS